RKVLEEYGGVFLADVVGLGKTYMAALIAQQLDGRSLVIAPPHLLDRDNPGSWPNVFGDFRVPHTDFRSIGKLEELLDRDVTRYQNVFIDESHRFRTETTQSYEMLAQICRGKRIILVSATPLNNTPRDMLSQIKLFQNGKNSTIPNVRNLEAFFARLESNLKELDRQRDREQFFATVQANAKATSEQIIKFMKILLVKRLESSFRAFRLTVARFIRSYERVITEFQKGQVYISKKHINKVFDLLEADDDEGIDRLLEAEKAERLDAADFNPDFIKRLRSDLKTLRLIEEIWDRVRRDPKWLAFRDVLKSSKIRSSKLIILTA